MTTDRTCLAIADISGYSSYLAGVELDHAQDILADLLTATVDPLRPVFRVAKLEGDAVFLFAPIDEVDGSVLLDLVEGCYFGFRRRLRTIASASTCTCRACERMQDLDLKLVVHHGEALVHEVLGQRELVGTDVVIAHRLLKNSIRDELDVSAYALLTDACVESTTLDPQGLGMLRHEQDYDDVGPVAGWVHDLALAWQTEQERHQVHVSPGEALWSSEAFLPDVQPGVAWEWMTVPSLKIQFESGFDEITEDLPAGSRRGVGGRVHCMHGEDTVDMEILDWRPTRYVTSQGTFPNGVPFVVTDEIEVRDGGVVARKNMRAPSPESQDDLTAVLEMFAPVLDTWMPRLAEILAERPVADSAIPEAPLPDFDESSRRASAVSSTD